jgi:hypothetical protein
MKPLIKFLATWNSDQVTSLIRKLLLLLSVYLTEHGNASTGTLLNGWSAAAALPFIISFIWSHYIHSDDPADLPEVPPANKLPIALLLIGVTASMFMVGCAGSNARLEAGGAYAPAVITSTTNVDGTVTTSTAFSQEPDFGYFAVESSFDEAESIIQAAFKFERDNRSMLWKISPEIKHSLDKIRPTAWEVVKGYIDARDAYIKNPTPTGLTAMQAALSKIQALAHAATAAQAVIKQ